jgi:hypothetical protein
MKYVLRQAKPKLYNGEQQRDNYGNLKYEIVLEDEKGELTPLNKSFKTAPSVGQELNGSIVEREYNGSKYKAFEAEQKAFGGSGRVENPERQNSIERQNSLTNAVNYCIAKANFLLGLNKVEEAEEEISGKHIITVATYFHKYTKGDITVVTESQKEEVATAEQLPLTEEVEEVVTANDDNDDDDIDPKDIPF